MKKLLLGAAAAAMTFAGFAASAQPYYGHSYAGAYARHDGDRYRRDWNGGRYAYYRYDRDRHHDRNDTAGAAILGGVVGLMLGAALADHNSQPSYNYGYNYGYQPYGSSYGYGYQPYGSSYGYSPYGSSPYYGY
jgi:hypothetical protein